MIEVINEEGKISWEEFVNGAIDKIIFFNENNIRTALNVLDVNGNGRISQQKLKESYIAEPSDKNDKIWEEII